MALGLRSVNLQEALVLTLDSGRGEEVAAVYLFKACVADFSVWWEGCICHRSPFLKPEVVFFYKSCSMG